ncbi:MAG: holo-ACP synthase [Planctomycetota bacterium]
MEIVGVGTDIVECVRIGKMLERHGEFFLGRVYTAREIADCQSQKGSVERFAELWAAKEATLKALGSGWGKGISWLDIEIRLRVPGRATVALFGPAREQALRAGIDQIMLSMAHCRAFATAHALAIRQRISRENEPE